MFDTLKTLIEVERELHITRPTLLKHMRRNNMQVKFDHDDHRVKLLDADQVRQLAEIVARTKSRTTNP
jgi:hypothetical protein